MSDTPDTRDAAAVRIFPPAVPLIALLIAWALQTTWPLPFPEVLDAAVREWVGWGIAIGAVLFLGAWSVALFRRSGQSENPWKPTTEIVARGPYRISRNPMYLQMLLILVGVGIATANAWMLLLVPAAVWGLQRWVIAPEEAYLERKFGEGYRAYTRRVRRWFGRRSGPATPPPGGPSSSGASADPPSEAW